MTYKIKICWIAISIPSSHQKIRRDGDGMNITYQITRGHRRKVKMGLSDAKLTVSRYLPGGFQVVHSEHDLDPAVLNTAQPSPHYRKRPHVRVHFFMPNATALKEMMNNFKLTKSASNFHQPLDETHLKSCKKLVIEHFPP